MSSPSPISNSLASAPVVNTSSLGDQEGNSSPAQTFDVALAKEQTKLDMRDYLYANYVGKKVNIVQNGAVTFSGMITKINQIGDSWVASIWDMRRNTVQAKMSFEDLPGLPTDITDRVGQLDEAQKRQRFFVENKISTSGLVEAQGLQLPAVSFQRPTQRIGQELPYKDVEANIIKKAYFIIRHDAIYLDNGRKITVKFEEP